MDLSKIIIADKSMPILELAIYRGGVDAETEGWLPCKFPERPIDRAAAIKHVIKGEDCKACGIAKDAFMMQNKRFVDGAT